VPTKKPRFPRDFLKPSSPKQLIFKRSAFHFEMLRPEPIAPRKRSDQHQRKILKERTALKSTQSLALSRQRLARWLLEDEASEFEVRGTNHGFIYETAS
jgi:hypothetical protein